MRRFKGIIALDIDGTITAASHILEAEVAHYLNDLMGEWHLIFLTGRTFSFARPILSSLKGEYHLAVQNGASLYRMPHAQCVQKNYLELNFLYQIDNLGQKLGVPILVESGKENGDICFYKPQEFNSEEQEYLKFRQQLSAAEWRSVDSFEGLPIQDFAVGKFFANEKKALVFAEELLRKLAVSVIVIRDPFRVGYHLGLISTLHASKGEVLSQFCNQIGKKLPIIAAGDDYNDVEMLEKSTVKIVMENGPERLRAMADIVAPPAAQQGIIEGLQKGIKRLESKS